MDQNNDWYERYSSDPAMNSHQNPARRSERHSVRLSTLIVFTMVAVLLGVPMALQLARVPIRAGGTQAAMDYLVSVATGTSRAAACKAPSGS